ncbi:type II toxin-antitoxin system RelE/ParE family toxin [Emticicia oligotrophica]|uniref:type II toxin-antitoxin system RelE/ParE family toxin n=1 Tax=Emticicia oligotrophica TaxID=312279 RepID=UPI00273C14ED|nr:type II toxin-antitoxin system RelE/ParE family toxin [Emticicia oligotrophica]
MNYDVITSESFVRELKRLAKKHLSLKNDVKLLGDKLASNPTQGTPIGKDCYKIRLAISSKGKGKSGGARVITAVFSVQEKVILLSIYDKADKENISDKELTTLLKDNIIG